MKCPNDNTTLLISERHGVEIDYCPECRGVWLDRNELDEIIKQAGQVRSKDTNNRDQRNNDDEDGPGGFLSDLFSFGD